MDTKKLRQKILDLAIHGKLVPQDPNDEPASVLLERIRAEKERLISEGKIKRSRKSAKTTDTPHYENVPFEVPENWEWTTLGEIGTWQSGATPSRLRKDYYGGNIPWLKTGDLNDGLITDIPEFITQKALDETSVKLNPIGSILIAMYGATIGKIGILTFPATTNQACCACSDYKIEQMYLFYFLLANKKVFIAMGGGGAQPNISKEKIAVTFMPLPPLTEQQRIVVEIERWFKLIDAIDQSKADLQTTITQTKSKILDLAIHGKLVPQDPNDEPASELLKRINPKAEITCDNEHYPKLPKGWSIYRLGDVVKYEQPTAYIVQSTAYSDAYPIPVLTAGKLFIIGHTKETEGIYNRLPCIIFDDFTTDSRLVDFPFKVKSSAMKILQVHYGVEVEYVSLFMSITRLVGDTHKRYWISEYSKLEIPIPPQEEQKRIIGKVRLLFEVLDVIEESL
ncbi:restriction endonuclease subunit S [Prevotella intermedia]|uniref:restriction endonuclease subunit S n=1 Tax=Prevotella intermedia TaxID=28131 RepID=UPI001E53BEFE|nr:restriction endonuclease subunit S [Prevotella intermedia]